MALRLFANCTDIDSARKDSISFIVLEELSSFKKRESNAYNETMLIDDNLCMVAYNFGKAANAQLSTFKLVVDTFGLVGRKHLFLEKIKELVAQYNYKDVSLNQQLLSSIRRCYNFA